MPRITAISEMWNFLDAYTFDKAGAQRAINHVNEWAGISRRINLPVFTAWADLTKYDKELRTTRALIGDADGESPVGVANQERVINIAFNDYAGEAAFFIIHAVDPAGRPRKISEIESTRIFVGSLQRDESLTYAIAQPRPL